MDLKDRIVNHEVEGEVKTCLLLGSDEFTVPRHMLQGEKMCGYIIKDGEATPWYWEGICSFGGSRYIYFAPLSLHPITEIATTFRSSALTILRSFATLLSQKGKKFADLQVGIIPLYRMYIIDKDTLLILPPDLADLFSVYAEDEERYRYLGAWAKGGTEEGFALVRQFGELLYFALTGKAPYEDRKIRQFGYKELPLDIYRSRLFPSLDEKSEGFVNFLLHAKSRDQRDIMGNRSADQNLSYFIEQSASLSWNVDNLTDEELSKSWSEIDKEGSVQEFWKKTEEGAKRHNFWRVKGTIIITSTIVAILVIAFAVSYISNLLKPPVTKDLEPVAVIEAFYDAQSALDVTALDSALKGVSAPQETEVINLYVNTQTRKAYESLKRLTAKGWIESGKGAIDNNTIIYGVSELEIEEIGENQYRANYIFYSPYAYEGSAAEQETNLDGTYLPLYVYKESQEFTFTWNKRGWWNITALTNPTVEYLRTERVPIESTTTQGTL